jgi:hypothetical protein
MSYYETYRSLDIEKKVLPRDFINLLPKLWLLLLTIERSDGTFVNGMICDDQLIIWSENLSSWLIPVKYIVVNECRRKYILINDLVLSGISLYEIANLKAMLNNGIYKSFVIANFHHISPQLTAMKTAPNIFIDNKMYSDFSRFEPETDLNGMETIII